MDNYKRCFYIKSRYLIPIYVFLLCFTQWLSAAAVYGKVTHSLSVPFTGVAGGSAAVSWSPLPEFSTVNFSFVKLGYRINGGGWTFQDFREAGSSVSLTQPGTWCFIVRGWDSNANQFGLFGSEQCTNVQNAPTPSAPSTPSGPLYHPINSNFSISWSPVAHASYYEVNGALTNHSSKLFSYSEYGRKSFQVRACNVQGQCGGLSSVKYVMVYSGPGAPDSLLVSKARVEVGESLILSWGRAGGAVPGLYYVVKRNSVEVYRGSTTSFTDVIASDGHYTYVVSAWNPNNLAGGSSSVSVQVRPKVVAPNEPILNITRNGDDVYYIPSGKSYSVSWSQQSDVSYSVTEMFNGISKYVGNTPLKNHSNNSYGKYTYKVNASNSAGSTNGQKDLYIYASPGFVGVPTHPKDVYKNERFNLEWTAAGGMVHTGNYEVWLNGRSIGSTQNTRYGPLALNTAGTYNYTIKSCNPELPCTGTVLPVEVKELDELPPEGVGKPIFESGTVEVVDYYYNKNEYLVWDVSQIKNAQHFKVKVQQLPRHIDGNTRTNLSTVLFDAELDGQYVKFKFDKHIDGFESGQWVRVKLTPCNATQCQDGGQKEADIVLVNWNNNQYFEGTPQHIASIAGETDSIGNFIFNKLWPRAIGQSAKSSGGSKFHYFYELEATRLMDAYMFPYNILPTGKQPDMGGELELDTSKKLFDGVSIWNMPARLKGFNRLDDTITDSALIPTFKTISARHFWREFFDNVFGVKRALKLQKVDKNGIIADFTSRYLLKPETFTNIAGNSETRPRSLLEGMHASASKVTGQFNNDRGVYIMLPLLSLDSPCAVETNGNCTEFAQIDEALHYKRLTLYIDEVIEQYTIFKNLYKVSPVKLAGFKWSVESASPANSVLCNEGNTAMCRSVYHSLLGRLKSYINDFSKSSQSGELELVVSTYSAIAASPNATPFSEIDCTDSDINRRECFTRFSQMQALDYEDHFDQIWFQPNATVERFHSKRGGSVKDQAVDREVLSWYVKGLFNKLQDEPKYSILIEYTRHSGKALDLSGNDFGFPHRKPAFDNPSHTNYIYPSYTDRLESDVTYPTGYYGDISYYFDYVMTQFPAPFRNGQRSFAYDDNGGVLLCYAEYVRGNKNFCNATAFMDVTSYSCDAGQGDVCVDVCKLVNDSLPAQCTPNRQWWVESWDLVESVSDVRSMYSFIEATHTAKRTGGYVTGSYLGDNNLFPAEPIIELHPDKTKSKTIEERIAVTPNQLVSAKALVRARLLEPVAFKNEDNEIESCSAQPQITLSFYKNEHDAQPFTSESVALDSSKLQYACMTHYRKLHYNNGGKGTTKGNYSGFWPDVDMWELLAKDFVVPSHATHMKITLETAVTGHKNNLEAYLFYRPEYKIQ
ncbi:hypothetical protein [Paraglaciecola sp.]|uniref:hypothetical protein n=1 Tax=Paraglaciecola sp. TaxID=1920173 RepID=UPI0030F3BC62